MEDTTEINDALNQRKLENTSEINEAKLRAVDRDVVKNAQLFVEEKQSWHLEEKSASVRREKLEESDRYREAHTYKRWTRNSEEDGR